MIDFDLLTIKKKNLTTMPQVWFSQWFELGKKLYHNDQATRQMFDNFRSAKQSDTCRDLYDRFFDPIRGSAFLSDLMESYKPRNDQDMLKAAESFVFPNLIKPLDWTINEAKWVLEFLYQCEMNKLDWTDCSFHFDLDMIILICYMKENYQVLSEGVDTVVLQHVFWFMFQKYYGSTGPPGFFARPTVKEPKVTRVIRLLNEHKWHEPNQFNAVTWFHEIVKVSKEIMNDTDFNADINDQERRPPDWSLSRDGFSARQGIFKVDENLLKYKPFDNATAQSWFDVILDMLYSVQKQSWLVYQPAHWIQIWLDVERVTKQSLTGQWFYNWLEYGDPYMFNIVKPYTNGAETRMVGVFRKDANATMVCSESKHVFVDMFRKFTMGRTLKGLLYFFGHESLTNLEALHSYLKEKLCKSRLNIFSRAPKNEYMDGQWNILIDKARKDQEFQYGVTRFKRSIELFLGHNPEDMIQNWIWWVDTPWNHKVMWRRFLVAICWRWNHFSPWIELPGLPSYTFFQYARQLLVPHSASMLGLYAQYYMYHHPNMFTSLDDDRLDTESGIETFFQTRLQLLDHYLVQLNLVKDKGIKEQTWTTYLHIHRDIVDLGNRSSIWQTWIQNKPLDLLAQAFLLQQDPNDRVRLAVMDNSFWNGVQILFARHILGQNMNIPSDWVSYLISYHWIDFVTQSSRDVALWPEYCFNVFKQIRPLDPLRLPTLFHAKDQESFRSFMFARYYREVWNLFTDMKGTSWADRNVCTWTLAVEQYVTQWAFNHMMMAESTTTIEAWYAEFLREITKPFHILHWVVGNGARLKTEMLDEICDQFADPSFDLIVAFTLLSNSDKSVWRQQHRYQKWKLYLQGNTLYMQSPYSLWAKKNNNNRHNVWSRFDRRTQNTIFFEAISLKQANQIVPQQAYIAAVWNVNERKQAWNLPESERKKMTQSNPKNGLQLDLAYERWKLGYRVQSNWLQVEGPIYETMTAMEPLPTGWQEVPIHFPPTGWHVKPPTGVCQDYNPMIDERKEYKNKKWPYSNPSCYQPGKNAEYTARIWYHVAANEISPTHYAIWAPGALLGLTPHDPVLCSFRSNV